MNTPPQPSSPDAPGSPLPAVSSETFARDVLQADRPVLVDFWASYCSVCRSMEPVLAALAAEFEGAVRVVALDVEAHPEVADRYDVRTLPTLLLFQDGEPLGRATGFVPQHVLAGHLRGATDAARAGAESEATSS